jgi:hypothetical protein
MRQRYAVGVDGNIRGRGGSDGCLAAVLFHKPLRLRRLEVKRTPEDRALVIIMLDTGSLRHSLEE